MGIRKFGDGRSAPDKERQRRMAQLQADCDFKGLPYPMELVEDLTAAQRKRQQDPNP